MAYTNIFLTSVADAVGQELARLLKNSYGLMRNVRKFVVPKGQSAVNVIIPGSITSTTRSAGSAYSAGTMPTDTYAQLAPNTEYLATIPIDRITEARSASDIRGMYVPLAASAILEGLSENLWSQITSDVTTNIVGSDSEGADMSLLAQAQRKLFDAKCPMSDLVCCIGGAEQQAWLPQGTFESYGPAGQSMLTQGIIAQKYGFNIVPDQDRYTSGGVGYNLAFHPLAMAVAFRSETVQRPGTNLGQYTNDLGVTIFVEEASMSESTNGVGTNLNVWCTAATEIVYEKYACIVKGTVS